MIRLVDESARTLLAELKDAELVTPLITEAVRKHLMDRECYTIEEFLLAGAEAIDERQWLSWLIRHHGCYRFGPVRLSANAVNWQHAVPPRDTPLPANLPYLRLDDGTVARAILRPDLAEEGYRAAATLRELRELKRDWERERP